MLKPDSEQRLKILSIETSCDETGVSLIEASGTAKKPHFGVLGNALYSQIDTHAEYGGVFPMLAKREHTLNLIPLLKSANEHAIAHECENGGATKTRVEVTPEVEAKIIEILSRENDLGPALVEYLKSNDVLDVDYVAVTEGPGLEPALWVGISFAKALAFALNKPLMPVNHMEGHIVSVLADEQANINEDNAPENTKEDQTQINPIEFPALALLISGGHTELVLCNDWHEYSVIGQTVDDAIGEAFDKVARLMNLQYPGGPKISKLAAESREKKLVDAYKTDSALGIDAGKGTAPWTLPRPMIKSPDFNFSFSGLKTAVRYAVQDRLMRTEALTETEIATLAEEFENAVTDVLVHKTSRAIGETGAITLIIGGGVIANTHIRSAFKKLADETGIRLFTPSVTLSTDNSVMIGIASYLKIISGKFNSLTREVGLAELKAQGNLSL